VFIWSVIIVKSDLLAFGSSDIYKDFCFRGTCLSFNSNRLVSVRGETLGLRGHSPIVKFWGFKGASLHLTESLKGVLKFFYFARDLPQTHFSNCSQYKLLLVPGTTSVLSGISRNEFEILCRMLEAFVFRILIWVPLLNFNLTSWFLSFKNQWISEASIKIQNVLCYF